MGNGLASIKGLSLLKESIRRDIVSCQKRKTVFGHSLISGVGGCGKSKLAKAIAEELGYWFEDCEAATLKTRQLLIDRLLIADRNAKSKNKTLLFLIDEIHRLRTEIQEALYFPLVENRITTALGQIIFKPMTIFGATTQPNKLDTNSFVARFVNNYELSQYDVSTIKEILAEYFNSMNLQYSWAELTEIAQRSLGIPRQALKLAQKVKSQVDYRGGSTEVTKADVNEVFRMLSIDDVGLDDLQRRYLMILFEAGDRPKGVKLLAAKLTKSVEELEDRIEPILLSFGYIDHTLHGRVLTDCGYKHLAHLGMV